MAKILQVMLSVPDNASTDYVKRHIELYMEGCIQIHVLEMKEVSLHTGDERKRREPSLMETVFGIPPR